MIEHYMLKKLKTFKLFNMLWGNMTRNSLYIWLLMEWIFQSFLCVCYLLTEFIWMTGRGGRNVDGHTTERQTEWREKGVITD